MPYIVRVLGLPLSYGEDFKKPIPSWRKTKQNESHFNQPYFK